MSTNNICFYKETDKKYTSCNWMTTKSLDCALIRVRAVIRSNTVITVFTLTLTPFHTCPEIRTS